MELLRFSFINTTFRPLFLLQRSGFTHRLLPLCECITSETQRGYLHHLLLRILNKTVPKTAAAVTPPAATKITSGKVDKNSFFTAFFLIRVLELILNLSIFVRSSAGDFGLIVTSAWVFVASFDPSMTKFAV